MTTFLVLLMTIIFPDGNVRDIIVSKYEAPSRVECLRATEVLEDGYYTAADGTEIYNHYVCQEEL